MQRALTAPWIVLAVLLTRAYSYGAPPSDLVLSERVLAAFDIDAPGQPLVVEITLNGYDRPLRMAIDTGSSLCVFDERLGKHLGVSLGEFEVKTLWGTKKMQRRPSRLLLLNDRFMDIGHQVLSTDLTPVREDSGTEIDGILGMDSLKGYVIQIDNDRRRLRFLDRVPADAGVKFELRFSSNGLPHVSGSVGSVGDEEFLIDTGAFVPNCVTAQLFEELKSKRELSRIESVYWADSVGKAANVARVRTMGIGEFVQRELRITAARRNVLGMRFLGQFSIVFDFPKAALYLKKCRDCDDADREDASGLSIITRKGKHVVAYVFPGSPASKAGIQIGDTLEQIDGDPGSDYSLSQTRDMLSHEGALVNLVVARDGQQRTVSLELCDYYEERCRSEPEKPIPSDPEDQGPQRTRRK